MRFAILLLLIILIACNNNDHVKVPTKVDTLKNTEKLPITKEEKKESALSKTYSNERFRDVTVERVSKNSFLICGKGQIFEANFSWIVEDGHEELMKGFQMTDAGAPEWGKFEFSINVHKKRVNSVLTLVLFESSPKDGSRQFQLPIPLY